MSSLTRSYSLNNHIGLEKKHCFSPLGSQSRVQTVFIFLCYKFHCCLKVDFAVIILSCTNNKEDKIVRCILHSCRLGLYVYNNSKVNLSLYYTE